MYVKVESHFLNKPLRKLLYFIKYYAQTMLTKLQDIQTKF